MKSDPLTAKELRGIARRGQTYVSRGVYVGLVGMLVYYFWTRLMARSAYLSPSEFAELGRDLFQQFVPLQMTLVTLAAIGAGADRIVKEARAGTLGLLLLTPLSPRVIALAKWKAAVSQAASLILCGAPVLAVCVYLGGVGVWELSWSLAVTAAMAALGAAFGIRASSIYSTVSRSILMGVLYLIGYTLLPLALLFMGGWPAIFVTPFVHPIYSAVMAVMATSSGSESIFAYGWIPSTLVSFFVAIWLLRGASKRMESRAGGYDAAPARPPPDSSPRSGSPLGFFLGRRESNVTQDMVVWEDQPLLWKELVTRAGARWTRESRALFALYASLFILLLWLFSQGRHQPTFGFLGACFTILALASGAALFAPEKEARKLEMLLSSPVTALEIVKSKLMSGLVAPEGRVALIVGVVTAFAFSWWSGPVGILVTIGVFLLFIAFTYVLSAAASLRAQTMPAAFLGSAGILTVILLILPLVARLLVDPTRGSISPAVYFVSALNPMWVIEPLADQASGAALGRFALYAAAYGTAIVMQLGFMVTRYDRIHGRA